MGLLVSLNSLFYCLLNGENEARISKRDMGPMKWVVSKKFFLDTFF